ncbi:hypothetical protein AB0L40_02375 [Patulibacter sp. NPDC049589]|uniref:PulJ/GspJ family protein n=1 Tax=Patulibacter sp. NPDC049589 TaxID=3154731 RepID=UPI0034247F1C
MTPRLATTVTVLRRLREDDDGFTLVEVLVTATLSIVVLLAILLSADVFGSSTEAASRQAGSQEIGRATLRQITDDVRQARQPAGEANPIGHTPVSSRNDLIAATYAPSATGVRQAAWVRYCSTADGKTLLTAVRIADAYPGPPGTCAVPTPASANPDPTAGWHYAPLIVGTLRGANTLFTYSSDTCFGTTPTVTNGCTTLLTADSVRTVGIRISVANGAAGGDGRPTVLQGAVSLRNRAVGP